MNSNYTLTEMNYARAKRLLKLDNLNYQQIAQRFNYQPAANILQPNSNKRKRTPIAPNTPDFQNKVRRFINDQAKKQIFKGTFYLRFSKLQNGQRINGQIPLQVEGTLSNIRQAAREEYTYRTLLYTEEYPEWDFEEFDDTITDDNLVPVIQGAGIVVQDKVVHTKVSGGQRVVFGHKSHLKMKHALYLKFGDDNQEWNQNNGTCVFDYLFWYYQKHQKKLFKTREKAYEYLNQVFRNNNTDNPLVDGVSVDQLETLCEQWKMCMYAYDKTLDEIVVFKPKEKNKNLPALVFSCFDEHFYPIPDKRKPSLFRRAEIKISCNFIGLNEKQTEPEEHIQEKQIIAPTREEFQELKQRILNNKIYTGVYNAMAMKLIQQNNYEVPFPLRPSNLITDENQIQKIIYDNKIILTHPIDTRVQQYYINNNLPYQGEKVVDIMNQIWKEMYNFTLMNAPFMSCSNSEVIDALSQSKIKWRSHLGLTEEGKEEDIKQLLLDDEAIAVDICKCYSNCMYNPMEDFIVFKGKEILEPYDNLELTTGLYFVETDDITLFHKSNWYSKMIIEKAKQENIPFQITFQIRCVDKWEHTSKVFNQTNIFKAYIEEVVKRTSFDTSLTKEIINSMSGFLGKTTVLQKNTSLGIHLQEVYEDWLLPQVRKSEAKTYIFNLKDIDNPDEKLYMYGFEEKSHMVTNGLPMYIQILDWSNIQLYDLTKRVGGTLLYRKTDMIISKAGILPEKYSLKPHHTFLQTLGKYRIDHSAVDCNYKETDYDKRYVTSPVLDMSWNFLDFNDSEQWLQIANTAIEKGGILIQGRAGTGKTHIIHKMRETGMLSNQSKSRLALTNKAARNIDGMTLHKALNINSKTETLSKMTNVYSACKINNQHILVIDEISMISADIWTRLMILKKRRPDLIFILLGDHRQCPPVENGKVMNYFEHPYVKFLVNGNVCELTTPKRYDMELWNWLEDFYVKDIIGDNIKKVNINVHDILNSKNICYFNETREKINDMCMQYMIKQNEHVFIPMPDHATHEKYDKLQNIWLYEGLPLMAIVANANLDIINSDEFIVTSFDIDAQIIELMDEQGEFLEITFEQLHQYFVVNYAITTHKSQGATFTDRINLFNWDTLSLHKKLGYTAVSRGKTCTQIYIVANIVP